MQKSAGRKLQLEAGEEFAARQGLSFAPPIFFRETDGLGRPSYEAAF